MRPARPRIVLRLAAASWLIGATAAEAAGEPMRGPRWAVTEPIAVRGGVLMVPLVADRPGNGWPRTLELTGQDGRELSGLVAWVHPSLPEGNARWTQDPRGLAVVRGGPYGPAMEGDLFIGQTNIVPSPIQWLSIDENPVIERGIALTLPESAGRVRDITPGPDNRMYVFCQNEVYRIDPA